MSLKEQVVQELESLGEPELEQVSAYVSFLRFQARSRQVPKNEEADWSQLYAEAAEEDHQLAEMGMAEYSAILNAEDRK